MTDLLSVGEFGAFLSNPDHPLTEAIATYAAALARIAELEDEKRDRIWGLLGDNHHNANLCPHCQEPLAKSREETRALAAELAELLAGLASIFANLDNPEKHSIFDSFAHEDRLRTLASQPQGELGKALLAVVEAARRKAPIRQPHDPACRCVDCELFLTLAVIYGAQP